MCQKAKDIQELSRLSSGDFIHCTLNQKTVVLYFNDAHGEPPHKYTDIETAIWLPRQDQLQDMTDYNGNGELLYAIDEFFESTENIENDMITMEQLWLALVMKTLYNKIWNGKDWVGL